MSSTFHAHTTTVETIESGLKSVTINGQWADGPHKGKPDTWTLRIPAWAVQGMQVWFMRTLDFQIAQSGHARIRVVEQPNGRPMAYAGNYGMWADDGSLDVGLAK